VSAVSALIPIAPVQQRMWAMYRTGGPSPSHNMATPLRLRGPLDREALRRAVADVVDRHAPLRTLLRGEIDAGRQEVLDRLPAQAAWQLRACTLEQAEAVVAREVGHAFDLGTEPPFRARLLAVAEDDHILSLVTHHLAFDGWSARVFHEDLTAAYAARRAGNAPDWKPLPITYADFALWQVELLGDRRDPGSYARELLDYWLPTLAGLPETLPLPCDRTRPADRRGGAAVALSIGPDVHGGLIEVARRCGATLFMAVHAAVTVLLHQYGAGTDIPVSAPLSGREEPDLERLVGLFINLVVLRADLSGRPAFSALLERIREVDRAAYDHPDLPLPWLAEALRPGEPAPVLARVLLAFDTGGLEQPQLDGLDVAPLPTALPGGRYDLAFHFTDQYRADGKQAGLLGAIEYATDLFDAETAVDLATRLEAILAEAAHAPDTPIDELGGAR